MQKVRVGADTVHVKTGTIDFTGNANLDRTGNYFSVVTFADGEKVRKVLVDATMLRFVEPGREGRFAFIYAGDKSLLVAVETDQGTFAADAETIRDMTKPQRNLMGVCTLIGLVTAFFLIGFVFLGLVALMWLSMAPLRRMIRVAKNIEKNGLPASPAPAEKRQPQGAVGAIVGMGRDTLNRI